MTLMKTIRPYYHAISIGVFCLSMLQSSTSMAASFEKSEDPIPAAVYGEAALPTMGLGAAVPTGPVEEPAATAGAGTGPSDGASVLSDHDSDDETFKGWISEARSVRLDWDRGVKQTIRGKRIQKKLDIAAAKEAELDARRAAFLAKIGEPLRIKEVPGGSASSAGGSASSATSAAEAALAAERSASAARIVQLEAALAAAEARSRVMAAAAIVPIPPAVPAIATGHEAFYRRLLAGRLEYRPTEGSDAGMVALSIGDLLRSIAGSANPLSAAFDLSRCGDAGKYLSINIGYKKAKVPANDDKTEIWICPKFLVERELATTASYLAPIMGQWAALVGYFWTWGGWGINADNYNYLLNGLDNDKNIYALCAENFLTRYHHRAPHPLDNVPGHLFYFTIKLMPPE